MKSGGSTTSFHPPWVGALVSAEFKVILLRVSLEEEQDPALSLHHCLVAISLFISLFLCCCFWSLSPVQLWGPVDARLPCPSPSPFVPIKSSITETYSRVSIMAKLRSQNGLDQKGFFSVRKAMPGSLSPVNPYLPSLLTVRKHHNLSIFLLIDTELFFPFEAIVSKAALNICVKSLWNLCFHFS